MHALPYFPLYPKDWLSDPDFQAMSDGQKGVLMVLLMRAWMDPDEPGTLPADDERLSVFAGISQEAWERYKPVVLRGWLTRPDGRWEHPALMRLANSAQDARRRMSDAGRIGGKMAGKGRSKRNNRGGLGVAKQAHRGGLGLVRQLDPDPDPDPYPETDPKPMPMAPPAPIPSDANRDGDVIRMLMEDMGFPAGEASRLSRHQGATVERVRWLVDQVKHGRWHDAPQANVAAGIVRQWAIVNGPCPAADFNSPAAKVARITARLNGKSP